MCAHLLLQKLQDYNLLLNNCQQENVGSKERPKQDGRRGDIAFRIRSQQNLLTNGNLGIFRNI